MSVPMSAPRSHRPRTSGALLRLVVAFSAVLGVAAGLPASAAAATTSGTLPRLSVTSDYVTGISSGGYMATQLQVAYSSRFAAAGIFSAGPYYCAQNSVAIALEACTSPPTVPDNLPASIAYTDHAAQAGLIDPTANLARQRTWFFHGTQDTVVAPSVADDLAAYYHHYGVPLTYRNTDPAGHAWISPLGPNPCGVNQLPYINNCGFDAEQQMLTTMFGSVHPPTSPPPKAPCGRSRKPLRRRPPARCRRRHPYRCGRDRDGPDRLRVRAERLRQRAEVPGGCVPARLCADG